MFSEVLKIVPKVDSSDLESMEKSLSTRFGNVAKKFGKGLLAAITGGGIVGASLAFLDKILNPLKETQEAIDRLLHRGDDIVTNAKQFGTTAGRLFKLQQFGQSAGLDPQGVNILLEKFQSAVARSALDPTAPSAVKQFVGEKDTAESFFKFIQALQGLEATQRNLVEQEVFGEKQILKASSFLGLDFSKKDALLFGGQSADKFDPALKNLGARNEQKNDLFVKRDNEKILRDGGAITAKMISERDAADRLADEKESKRIKSYDDLATIQEASDTMINLLEDALLAFDSMVASLKGLKTDFDAFLNSRFAKGIFKFLGGN